MANLNVNEIKRLILLIFPFLLKGEEIKQNNILTIMKLSPFSNSFYKLKELFDLIISKITSDGADFPRITKITRFRLYLIRQHGLSQKQ